MKRKLRLCLPVILIGLWALPQSGWADTPTYWSNYVATGFAGGDGSEESPHIIETEEQLAFLTTEVNSGTSPYTGKPVCKP